MTFGILFDTTRCIGCRACQVACKRWHDLPAERTELSQEWTNPPDVGPDTWLVVLFAGIGEGDEFKWRFTQRRCMHCKDPACVYVCPTTALRKMPDGPVVYDEALCIGCRYCVEACPFNIPQFNWETRKINKCNLCYDRLQAGLGEPACVQACPTDALEFGDRDELLQRAESKAASINGYVYGKEEAGGTDTIFVSDVSPSKLGLPKPRSISISSLTQEISLSTAGIGLVGAVVIGGIWYYSKRRKSVEEASKKEKAKEVD